MDGWTPIIPKKKKKVDLEALQSPLKRIPGMDIASVRDLMDLGFSGIDELKGRSPEAMFEKIKCIRTDEVPEDRLYYFRMAVYYAETDSPDAQLMEAWRWQDRP